MSDRVPNDQRPACEPRRGPRCRHGRPASALRPCALLCFLLTPALLPAADELPALVSAEAAELDAAAAAAIADTSIGNHRIELAATPLYHPLPRPQPTPVHLRVPAGDTLRLAVDCGRELEAGWQYRDEQDRLWLADRRWQEGAQWGAEGGECRIADDEDTIEEAAAATLYTSQRSGLDGYRFALPPGRYDLRLHFVESRRSPESVAADRGFTVSVNGEPVRTAFDPLRAAGAIGRPVIEVVEDIDCADGELRIAFDDRLGPVAALAALEIEGREALDVDFAIERGLVAITPVASEAPADPGEAVGRYLCGHAGAAPPGYELAIGETVWWPAGDGARHGFWPEGGGVHEANATILIQNTRMPQVYRRSRFGGGGYQIQVPEAASYTVRVHVVQNREYAGDQSFDILIEDKLAIADIDPITAGGGLAHPAVFEVLGVRVEDGQLSLSYREHSGESSLSAIEVFRAADDAETRSARQVVGPAERRLLRPTPEQGEPLRVLFVGNSHTFFWHMPQTVATQVNLQPGSEVFIQPYWFLHGGKVLTFFADNRPGGDRPSLASVMRAGHYDVVVLQVLTTKGFSGIRRMLAALQELAGVAEDAGTRVVLYAYHPIGDLDGFTRRSLMALVERHQMVIVPFGDAHQAFFRAKRTSELSFDLEGVGPHLGFHQAYVNACIHGLAWTGRSPLQHPAPTLYGTDLWVEDPQADFIQTVADQAWSDAVDEFDLESYAERHAVD